MLVGVQPWIALGAGHAPQAVQDLIADEEPGSTGMGPTPFCGLGFWVRGFLFG